MIGNSYSVFLSFSGGKGIATGLGILLFLFSPAVLLGYCLIFALVLALMRRVDVASLSAALGGGLLVALAGYPAPLVGLSFALAIWTLIRHKKNVIALMKG
jgi:glycerol-3-phosphate acyltransferase PlsY